MLKSIDHSELLHLLQYSDFLSNMALEAAQNSSVASGPGDGMIEPLPAAGE